MRVKEFLSQLTHSMLASTRVRDARAKKRVRVCARDVACDHIGDLRSPRSAFSVRRSAVAAFSVERFAALVCAPLLAARHRNACAARVPT